MLQKGERRFFFLQHNLYCKKICHMTFVAKISKAEAMKIAETKMPDLNAASIEAAYSMICGTARSMGITVEE